MPFGPFTAGPLERVRPFARVWMGFHGPGRVATRCRETRSARHSIPATSRPAQPNQNVNYSDERRGLASAGPSSLLDADAPLEARAGAPPRSVRATELDDVRYCGRAANGRLLLGAEGGADSPRLGRPGRRPKGAPTGVTGMIGTHGDPGLLRGIANSSPGRWRYSHHGTPWKLPTAFGATIVRFAVTMVGTSVGANAAPRAGGPSPVRLHLPTASAGGKTVRFGRVLTFAAPEGWVRTALPAGSNPSSEANFRVRVSAGCTALAFASPQATATAVSARTQLRRALPDGSQSGIPVPPPVRIVETRARAHAGARQRAATGSAGFSDRPRRGILLQLLRRRAPEGRSRPVGWAHRRPDGEAEHVRPSAPGRPDCEGRRDPSPSHRRTPGRDGEALRPAKSVRDATVALREAGATQFCAC